MNTSFPLRFLSVSVLGIAAGMSLMARAQAPDSEKIQQLFKQMRVHAIEAEYDAQLLDSYTRASMAPQTHANRIVQMSVDVRDLRKDFDTAKELRPLGSEWQKDAIDQIEPLLQQMADQLSVSIGYLNNHRQQIQMQPWTDYVRGNRDLANKTARLIDDYVDYGESRAKAEAAQQKPGTSGQT